MTEREPPRQVWHLLPLVALVALILGSTLASNRPLMVARFNNVAPAGAVPPGVEVIDDWSAVIHRSDWRTPLAQTLGRMGVGREPRLGWIVREWSLMSLPLFAYRQSDLIAFREGLLGYEVIGLEPDQLARVRAAGMPWFPWWRYVWGWLGVLVLAVFVWGELRWQARRRELLGVM